MRHSLSGLLVLLVAGGGWVTRNPPRQAVAPAAQNAPRGRRTLARVGRKPRASKHHRTSEACPATMVSRRVHKTRRRARRTCPASTTTSGRRQWSARRRRGPRCGQPAAEPGNNGKQTPGIGLGDDGKQGGQNQGGGALKSWSSRQSSSGRGRRNSAGQAAERTKTKASARACRTVRGRTAMYGRRARATTAVRTTTAKTTTAVRTTDGGRPEQPAAATGQRRQGGGRRPSLCRRQARRRGWSRAGVGEEPPRGRRFFSGSTQRGPPGSLVGDPNPEGGGGGRGAARTRSMGRTTGPGGRPINEGASIGAALAACGYGTTSSRCARGWRTEANHSQGVKSLRARDEPRKIGFSVALAAS